MPAVKAGDNMYHGAACELVAGPGLEIVGTIRDQDTGKPLGGVIVQKLWPVGNPLRFLKTTTDAEGRYRLQGLPLNPGELIAEVKDGPAYLASVQHVGNGRGLEPIRKDFERFAIPLDFRADSTNGPRVTHLGHLNRWRNAVAHQAPAARRAYRH